MKKLINLHFGREREGERERDREREELEKNVVENTVLDKYWINEEFELIQ